MDDACDELDEVIDSETKGGLMRYFQHMAHVFAVGSEKMKKFSDFKLYEDLPVNNFATKVEENSDESDFDF